MKSDAPREFEWSWEVERGSEPSEPTQEVKHTYDRIHQECWLLTENINCSLGSCHSHHNHIVTSKSAVISNIKVKLTLGINYIVFQLRWEVRSYPRIFETSFIWKFQFELDRCSCYEVQTNTLIVPSSICDSFTVVEMRIYGPRTEIELHITWLGIFLSTLPR